MAMRPLPFRFGGPFHSSDATRVMLIADVGKAGNKQSKCLSDARQRLTSVLSLKRVFIAAQNQYTYGTNFFVPFLYSLQVLPNSFSIITSSSLTLRIMNM